jgi:hypothetical protein
MYPAVQNAQMESAGRLREVSQTEGPGKGKSRRMAAQANSGSKHKLSPI